METPVSVIDKRGKIIGLWEKGRRGGGVFILLKGALIFFSFLFCLTLILRKFAYRCGLKKSARVNAKVISVGNITLGGTGKTPLVEYIARKAKENNKNVVILTRGYGRKSNMPMILYSGSASAEEVGDEVKVFLNRNKDIPVVVGKDRGLSGKEAVGRLGAEILLLDDGFQHWRMHRDIDIVNLDSAWPIWKDRLIPAGTLREKICGLKRADVFVLTRVETDSPYLKTWLEYLRRINPGASVLLSRHRPEEFIARDGERFPLSIIRDRDITAFSGIAKPEAFEETLKGLRPDIRHLIRYPDHYLYKLQDIEEIAQIAQESRYIITTEKDIVRITSNILDNKLLALVINIELEQGDRLLSKIIAQ